MDINYILKLLLIFGLLLVLTGAINLFLNKLNSTNLFKTKIHEDCINFFSEIFIFFFLVFAALSIIILVSLIGYVIFNLNILKLSK